MQFAQKTDKRIPCPGILLYSSSYALYCNCTLPRFRPLHSGGVGGGEGREEGRRVEGGTHPRIYGINAPKSALGKLFQGDSLTSCPLYPPPSSFTYTRIFNIILLTILYSVQCQYAPSALLPSFLLLLLFRSTSFLLTAPSLPLYFLRSNCSFSSALFPSF